MDTKLVYFVIINWYSIVWIISCLFSLTGSYRTTASLDCGDVNALNIDHAAHRRQYNGTKYLSTADVNCDEGYYIKGQTQLIGISTQTITCSYTGKWKDIPICIPKDCGPLKDLTISNADLRLLFSVTNYGSKAAITCDEGYYDLNKYDKIEGISTTMITCSVNGIWNDLPNCTRKDCGNVNELYIDHAAKRRQNNGTKYTSTADVDCDEGYYIRDHVQMMGISTQAITCSNTGKWKDMPICIPKDCGGLSNITMMNAVSRVSINGTKYTAIANVSCDVGFKDKNETQGPGVTSKFIRCNESGVWDNLPKCVKKDCGKLEDPAQGKVNLTNGTEYQSVARYTCDTGYTLYGDNTARCQSSGNWTKHYINCTINDCGQPARPINGDITTNNGTTFQSVAIYSCYVGYDLIGTNTTKCQANKTWSLPLPGCSIRSCSHPEKPANGAIDTSNGTTYLSRITYSCKPGYGLNGNNTAFCLANKTWSSKTPSCNIKTCDSLVNPHNGYVKRVQGTRYNDNATYTCNTGYRMQGAGFVTCTARGNWSSPPPLCKDIDECAEYHTDCDLYASCTNTKGSYSCNCQKGFRDLSSGRGQKCQDVDECSNSSTNFCNKNGSRCINYMGGFICMCFHGWTGGNCTEDIDECADNTTCGPHATCKNSPGSYNCMCDDGYPQGDPKVHCYNCGLLVPPKDGFVVTRNGTKFGASSEFRCNPGYTLYGDSFTTCLSNGTWQNYHVNCILDKKAVPTICFSCDGMSSPEYCDKVEHCQPNQICYTESYQTDYGKVFRSGCMDEEQCHREENSISNSVCVECCTSEMCNNQGCGNADFPPREHRGPMCFDCQHIGDINSCRKVTMCASDQVCSIEKQQWGDTYHYKLGCTHHLCNSLLHQISGTVSSCHACCRDDYCNKNCTSSSSSPGEIFIG